MPLPWFVQQPAPTNLTLTSTLRGGHSRPGVFIDIDQVMRAAFVIEFFVVLGVRPFFAGGLQLGEAKGREWHESPVYVLGGIPLMGGWVWAVVVYLSSTDLPWMYLGSPDLVRWVGLVVSLATFAGFMVFIAIVRVPHEEGVLVAHFGDEYRRYMACTSKFLPLGSRQGRGLRGDL